MSVKHYNTNVHVRYGYVKITVTFIKTFGIQTS